MVNKFQIVSVAPLNSPSPSLANLLSVAPQKHINSVQHSFLCTISRDTSFQAQLFQGQHIFFESCLSDPGVPGVRSMGPVVSHKLSYLVQT